MDSLPIVTVSLGSVGALVADHYIGRKFPKSKRWLSVINSSVGGVSLYATAR
jgi:hypothetical protein